MRVVPHAEAMSTLLPPQTIIAGFKLQSFVTDPYKGAYGPDTLNGHTMGADLKGTANVRSRDISCSKLCLLYLKQDKNRLPGSRVHDSAGCYGAAKLSPSGCLVAAEGLV
jgi:hypothetical protein